ncbi:winged helix-turn-helix domain-containing protein [Clostridium sp. C2-6-12]|uniref:ArsR/SmtB family transcription factor n=1 Tax=Clostridium sp. C2-6-12 TaxID=2698832 RepID=UPI001369F691|nr:winged helix-turn-helix domain-containing protein [Clostridium sp. C2-6-12]
MKDSITLTSVEEIKAFSDPYRYKILMCFYNMKRPCTVKEIAVALDEVPANVHYHVKKLEKVNILKLVHTKEINGIIAKYYEPTAKSFNINSLDQMVEPVKKLILSESKQAISQIYDDSKNIFLNHMENSPDSKHTKNSTLSMENLYLTENQAKEFAEYIKNFMENHCNDSNNDEELKHYHCFFTIVGLNN